MILGKRGTMSFVMKIMLAAAAAIALYLLIRGIGNAFILQ